MNKNIFYCILAVFFTAAVFSCKGPEGKEGPAGPTGPQGPAGTAGIAGIAGKDGSVVTIGADGFWYIDGKKTAYRVDGSHSIPREGMVVVAKFFDRIVADSMQKRVNIAKQLGANQLLVFPNQVTNYPGVAEILDGSGIDLWLIAPFFYNDDNRSTAQIADFGREPNWAICDDGELAWEVNSPNTHPSGSWLRVVCPNDQAYIDYRIESLKPALRACNFTGLSLDFMRHFVYWEGTYSYTNPSSLRNACFCEDCVDKFVDIYGHTSAKPSNMSSEYRITNSAANNNLLDRFVALVDARALLIAGDVAGSNEAAIKAKTVEIANFVKANLFRQWTHFKCATIDNNVEYILAKVREEFPNLKSNIHAVPFTSNSFNGAIRSIAGQDFKLLANRLDQISPMTYDRLCVRPAYWINEITTDVVNVVASKVPVVPTIEGRGNEDSDYEASLINALKYPSSGVVIWRFESLTPERIAITDRILNNK